MKIFWMVGEVSGDLHASYIIRELKKRNFGIEQYGVGGNLMVEAGLNLFKNFDKINIMGFWEVFKNLFFLLKFEKSIKKELILYSPDLLVLVDYPGMNLRLAKFAKKKNIKVLYYISPKFWAWKKKRVKKLKKFTDLVASIFPFETNLLKENYVNAYFVGNPIKEEISCRMDKKSFATKYSILPSKKWIGFFPGSRASEIKRLMPVFLQTITKLRKIDDIEILISQAQNQDFALYLKTIKELNVSVVKDLNYEMMSYCDFLVLKSGTTTLEAALINTPHVIVYKTSSLSYFIARLLIKIKWIGLPNIIMNENVVPEFIQSKVNAESLFNIIDDAVNERLRYREISENLNKLNDKFLDYKPSEKVSALILEMINDKLEEKEKEII